MIAVLCILESKTGCINVHKIMTAICKHVCKGWKQLLLIYIRSVRLFKKFLNVHVLYYIFCSYTINNAANTKFNKNSTILCAVSFFLVCDSFTEIYRKLAHYLKSQKYVPFFAVLYIFIDFCVKFCIYFRSILVSI